MVGLDGHLYYIASPPAPSFDEDASHAHASPDAATGHIGRRRAVSDLRRACFSRLGLFYRRQPEEELFDCHDIFFKQLARFALYTLSPILRSYSRQRFAASLPWFLGMVRYRTSAQPYIACQQFRHCRPVGWLNLLILLASYAALATSSLPGHDMLPGRLSRVMIHRQTHTVTMIPEAPARDGRQVIASYFLPRPPAPSLHIPSHGCAKAPAFYIMRSGDCAGLRLWRRRHEIGRKTVSQSSPGSGSLYTADKLFTPSARSTR